MCLSHLRSTANSTIMRSQNHFPDPNRHILTCLHQILLCRSYTEHRWRCSNPRHLGGQPVVRGYRFVGESGTPQQPVKSTGYMIC
jgi:hypothetical protein